VYLVNNNKVLLPVILLVLFVAMLFPSSALASPRSAGSEIPIYFFWGDGCPHCAAEEPFLESLAQKYPQVKIQKYEVWNVEANQLILEKVAGIMGFEASGVPVTIIGEKYWIGYSETRNAEMEAAVNDCIQNSCKSPIDPKILSTASATGVQKTPSLIFTLPLIGKVDLGKQLFLVIAILLAFFLVLFLGFNFLFTKVSRGKHIRNHSGSKKYKKKKLH
jgi:thiol-disulfide isomerase/thioredoxin